MTRKKLFRWLFAAAAVCVATGCLLIGFLYLLLSGAFTTDAQAIKVTREWARLDPFPQTATQVDVVVEGSAFSREFTVTFIAPLKDIDAWLESSPGTADLPPGMINSGVRIYQIEPGGGAQHVELRVDEKRQQVSINAYWS